ncbi:hypothetical protein ACJMK2_041560 [Sinanodonta woodiana]|uniref:Prolactin receptor n=1 Tax=Sinanodonta woodiana TaxID=1069815 RepID=A0ABD3W587_SINWO
MENGKSSTKRWSLVFPHNSHPHPPTQAISNWSEIEECCVGKDDKMGHMEVVNNENRCQGKLCKMAALTMEKELNPDGQPHRNMLDKHNFLALPETTQLKIADEQSIHSMWF